MTRITLQYDSQNLTTTLKIDGKPLSLNCLGTGEGHSIGEWKGAFFGELSKKCNFGPGSECTIVFFGDDEGHAALEGEMGNYARGNNGIRFELEKGEEKVETVLKCRNCGYELKPHWVKCPKCKTPVSGEAAQKKCRHCGEELEDWMDECPACGKPVEEAAKDASAEPAKAGEKPPERSTNPEVEALKDRAEELMEAEEYDNAIVELTKAIRLDPNDAVLYKLRGNAHGWKGSSYYSDDDIEFEVAEEKKKIEDNLAIEDYSEAIKLNPNDDEAFVSRGNLYSNQDGRAEEAIADFNTAIKINANNPRAYNSLGLAYQKKNQHKLAIQCFTKALDIKKEGHFFWNRGEAYEAKGDSSNARADYLEAGKLEPFYWWWLGDKYKNQGKLQESINAYTENIKAAPDAFAYSRRADAYKESDDTKKALADYSKAIELEPSAHYYSERAAFYFGRDKFGSAATDYTTTIKLITESEEKDDLTLFLAYRDRGHVYANMEKFDRAIGDFTKAIQLERMWYLFRYRGQVYKVIEDYESALEDFNTAIELYNEEAEIDDEQLANLYSWRGSTYTWLEKWDKAKADFKKALRLDPGNEQYREQLEQLVFCKIHIS